MKFTKPLDTILNTETKTRLLRFLCKTNAEWNGSQIAKGVTPAAVLGEGVRPQNSKIALDVGIDKRLDKL